MELRQKKALDIATEENWLVAGRKHIHRSRPVFIGACIWSYLFRRINRRLDDFLNSKSQD